MGIFGAEGHVVAHHHHCRAAFGQTAQDGGQLVLKGGVQPLGGLVQQQDLGTEQQHLRQRGPLPLAAGKIKGVTGQKRFQMAEGDHLTQTPVGLLPVQRKLPQQCGKVFAHGGLDKEGLGILGQQAEPTAPGVLRVAAQNGDPAPIGDLQPRHQAESCGFSHAVSSQNRQNLAGIH